MRLAQGFVDPQAQCLSGIIALYYGIAADTIVYRVRQRHLDHTGARDARLAS